MAVQILCPNPHCGAPISTSGLDFARGARCPRCGQELVASSISGAGTPVTGPGNRPDPAPRPLANPSDLAEGSSFGRYSIVRRLGQGDMGAVYRAHDTQLDCQVALKVPYFSPHDGPEALERFQREARSAVALHHRTLCAVYDIGQVDGAPYLTMAYIEGRPLSALIERERLPPHCILRYPYQPEAPASASILLP